MKTMAERANEASETHGLQVAHILAALRPSGAERMLQCSLELVQRQGVDPVIVGISDQPHPFEPVLRNVGYETVIILKRSRSIGGLRALRSTLTGLQPDIVHVHTESMFPLVYALAKTTPGVRGVVRSIHNNFVYAGLLKPRRVVFSQVTAALGVVSVACGAEVADNEAHRYHYRPQVLENWVDVTDFGRALPERARVARNQLGLASDDFVVMLLGNCEPAKGHSLLLSAVADVRCPIVVLHVGSEQRADDEERRRWEQLAPRHRLLRLGSRHDSADLLAAADVLAMPSEHEGFPVAAAESFCAATPVMAAAVPGLGWVTDFRTGRALERTITAWTDGLEQAAERRWSDDWQQSCRQDAEDARRRFSPERGVTEWCHIYEMSVRASHGGLLMTHNGR